MFNTLHLAPSLLVVFMAILAVVPLALVWLDNRRRDTAQDRLHRLRQDATLRDTLARRAAMPVGRPERVIVPGE